VVEGGSDGLCRQSTRSLQAQRLGSSFLLEKSVSLDKDYSKLKGPSRGWTGLSGELRGGDQVLEGLVKTGIGRSEGIEDDDIRGKLGRKAFISQVLKACSLIDKTKATIFLLVKNDKLVSSEQEKLDYF
jgi:hypothetical protein